MGNALRALVPIVQHVCPEKVREEAAGLIRILYPGNLKRLGGRRFSVNRARQDGGALAATALMMIEAASLGATPEELLACIIWLRSFVDALKANLDASDAALTDVSVRETLAEARQNVPQILVASGDRSAEAELLRTTIEEVAIEMDMIAVLRKRQSAS